MSFLTSGHFAGGIDENPTTLAYSIYLALWSVTFLNSWSRRENELKFLWGSEGYETVEKPRPQFKGEHIPY